MSPRREPFCFYRTTTIGYVGIQDRPIPERLVASAAHSQGSVLDRRCIEELSVRRDSESCLLVVCGAILSRVVAGPRHIDLSQFRHVSSSVNRPQ